MTVYRGFVIRRNGLRFLVHRDDRPASLFLGSFVTVEAARHAIDTYMATATKGTP